MYFPYVRGRQYELLALRELAEKGLLGSRILPVIEPVKLSSTLYKTMEEFIEKGQKLGIVCNPAVGSFDTDMTDRDKDTNRQRFLELLKSPSIVKAHIMKPDSQSQIPDWEAKVGCKREDWLVINSDRDCVDAYQELFRDTAPRYVLIPDRFRRAFRTNKVLFEDRFEKCDRNSDYQKHEDEFFSEDHLFYEQEGFAGFGDYSVIGKDYLESGFAPYAVAIHIVYFAPDQSLRVHHFVSDSNEGIHNPAKKFYEAVGKLNAWTQSNETPVTQGLTEFLEHYRKQSYPGLGSAKKLTLMHHLELMGRYLIGK